MSMRPLVLFLAMGASVAAFAQQTVPAPATPPPGTVPITSQTPAIKGEEPNPAAVAPASSATATPAKKHKHKKNAASPAPPTDSTPPPQ